MKMKRILSRFITITIIIVGIVAYARVFANTAVMDPSFDTGLPVGFNTTVYTIAKQSDGKIIV
jgi:hypothetical protein